MAIMPMNHPGSSHATHNTYWFFFSAQIYEWVINAQGYHHVLNKCTSDIWEHFHWKDCVRKSIRRGWWEDGDNWHVRMNLLWTHVLDPVEIQKFMEHLKRCLSHLFWKIKTKYIDISFKCSWILQNLLNYFYCH